MTKNIVCAGLGAIGGAIASAFGGWDAALNTLVGFMAADYVAGLTVAGVFKKSDKSASGGLESRAGFKGLFRKVGVLLAVYVAAKVDILMGTTFVRNATALAFVVNEALSIFENLALMGVPLPSVLEKSLEVLKRDAENPSGTEARE